MFILQESSETYSHLFVTCPVVEPIWIKIEEYMNSFNKEQIHFSVDTVICNHLVPSPRNIKNSICSYFKQYLYRKRCFKELPSFEEFVHVIQQTRNIEAYIAKKNNNFNKHLKKWTSKMNPRTPLAEQEADIV